MTTSTASIRLQTPNDREALLHLTEQAFGPGRFARSAHRVREEAPPEPRLCLCAVSNEAIVGAVQFTPITIGGNPGALLLGPLVIHEDHKNRGHGLRLMVESIGRAREIGYRLVILVGDLPYYARAGFAVVPAGRIFLPGPVDPARLLYVALTPNALEGYQGMVRGHDNCAGM